MANTKTLKLLDNIQFIYELALARLELQSFKPVLKVTNDFREFELKDDGNFDVLKRRLAYFKTIDGDYSDYYNLQKYNQTKSVNQYLTHWIYPYKGKFHPQMIRALMNIIKIQNGETLFDPFVGSGTAVLEAQILGINAIGLDISPLCVLISKVKTESVDIIDEIKKYKDYYLFKKNGREPNDERIKNFYKVAEMMAHSDQSRRGRNFDSSFVSDALKMIASVEDYSNAIKKHNLKIGKTKIIEGDTRKINLKDESVDGIITSPPYSIALNYVANDAHSLKALGYDLDKIKEDFIGVRGTGLNKFELYDKDMEKAYSEMYRVLKKDKYCVVVIGNVTFQGQEINTTQNVIEYCEKMGFKTIKKMEKIIYGLYNVMQKEYILIFQK
ncbi:MAG: putative RNA methylase [Candidatus Berkelbacteria bacterium Licking1014_7]|uniref:site-specific DNA-methyltransferase (cytosine-N(4)-specific) n=1 Tax=Candidatus Berkelbacteria bacterium Licking1014_7 TaxID=2017147 RepID=A0A554LJR6_9BACT|nr:MAG: putative RNA methylase [Candidatus Berkelbacteria bacterium Licking1014_7]